jgi:hypothetical protein
VRTVAGVFLAAVSIASFSWFADAFAWLGWVVLFGTVAVVVVGSFVVIAQDARRSRSREVMSRHPARRDSLPRSGRPGRDSHAGGTRPASRSQQGPGGRWW